MFFKVKIYSGTDKLKTTRRQLERHIPWDAQVKGTLFFNIFFFQKFAFAFGFYKIGDLHSLEYIPGYGWFVINVNGDGFGVVSPTSSTSGTYLDANGTSQSFSSNFASSSNGVLTIAHGGGTITLNEADFFTDGVLPTPTFRTGTSQGFAFTSGVWKDQSYTAVLDDEVNSSLGKLVNGVRQWEWDMPDIGGGRLYSGENNWIYFVPGTAEDNGTWYHGTTSTGGTAGTRNGRVLTLV